VTAVDVVPSSVPSHISKTKQDRFMVTVKTVRKLALLILLPRSYESRRAALGRCSRFTYKMCADINVALCSTWHQTPQLLSTQQTIVSLPVLSAVVNRL